MEPYINIIIPPSKLDKLNDELKDLRTYADKIGLASQNVSYEMNEKLANIREEIDIGKVHIKDLVDMSEDLVNKTGIIASEFLDQRYKKGYRKHGEGHFVS